MGAGAGADRTGVAVVVGAGALLVVAVVGGAAALAAGAVVVVSAGVGGPGDRCRRGGRPEVTDLGDGGHADGEKESGAGDHAGEGLAGLVVYMSDGFPVVTAGGPLVDGEMAGGQAPPPGQGPGGAALVGGSLEHGVEVVGSTEEVEGVTVGGPLLGPVTPRQQGASGKGDKGADDKQEGVGTGVSRSVDGRKLEEGRGGQGASGGGQGGQLGVSGRRLAAWPRRQWPISWATT